MMGEILPMKTSLEVWWLGSLGGLDWYGGLLTTQQG